MTGARMLAILLLSVPSGRPPSEAVYRHLCRSIRLEHVRPLFTTPPAPIRLGGDADCTFTARDGSAGVQVFLRIDDGDSMLWDHRGDRGYGTFRWLSKRRRLAKWGYEGGAVPSVVDARSGSFTCTLIPFGTTGLALPRGPALAAARAYAERLLPLCDDAYAAR
ncbi:MAG: hypothetical protein ABUS54_10100 [Actinomycetota bacterium]